MSLRKKSSI